MKIGLFYYTVHFSTQEPERLFESKNYLGLVFCCFGSFFSGFGLRFLCCFVGVFNPLNLVHKAGLH